MLSEFRTVLLLSEDEPLRLMLRGYLEHVGYMVLSCKAAPNVFPILGGRHRVDLLVVDGSRLGGSLPDLAEKLTSDYPHLPVISIHGAAEEDNAEQHGWKALHKPLALPDVLCSIRDAIDPELLSPPSRVRSSPSHAQVSSPGRTVASSLPVREP